LIDKPIGRGGSPPGWAPVSHRGSSHTDFSRYWCGAARVHLLARQASAMAPAARHTARRTEATFPPSSGTLSATGSVSQHRHAGGRRAAAYRQMPKEQVRPAVLRDRQRTGLLDDPAFRGTIPALATSWNIVCKGRRCHRLIEAADAVDLTLRAPEQDGNHQDNPPSLQLQGRRFVALFRR
jgi:hypothetical protein